MKLLLIAVAVLGLQVASAQTSTPATEKDAAAAQNATPSFRSETTLVFVPTLVRDKSGKPVFTLTANDFTVTDNGLEQKVSLEDNTDSQPLALVVAVETGGGGAEQLGKYGNLPSLVEALVGDVPHQVAVVSFDSTAHLSRKFTSNWQEAAEALQSLSPGDGGAAILDGLDFSVGLLRKQPPEYRRAILLLSETNDHGSQMGMAEAVRAVSDTNTIVYALAFSSSRTDFKRNGGRILRDDRPGPPHGCMGKDPADPDQNKALQAWNCLGLLVPPLRVAQLAVMAGISGFRKNTPEAVAQLTGGEYFKFGKEKSLDSALFEISNHVPNRYVLSFHPQPPTPGPHALEVKLKEYSGLSITARKTYWIETGAGQAGQTPSQ